MCVSISGNFKICLTYLQIITVRSVYDKNKLTYFVNLFHIFEIYSVINIDHFDEMLVINKHWH